MGKPHYDVWIDDKSIPIDEICSTVFNTSKIKHQNILTTAVLLFLKLMRLRF
tara:strand:+ start:1750 stop:1905 length:156 start_codon:yes stop_codon:yes gene_type:complete